MKKLILFLPLVLLLSSLSFGQSNDELHKKASDCFAKGDYECAEKHYMKMIKKEPDKIKLAGYYSDLGTCQRRIGKKDQALKSYDLAIENDPGLIIAYTNRATLN